MNDAYHEFLARKAVTDPMTGLASFADLPAQLFHFHRDITSWSLRRGRSAQKVRPGATLGYNRASQQPMQLELALVRGRPGRLMERINTGFFSQCKASAK